MHSRAKEYGRERQLKGKQRSTIFLLILKKKKKLKT